MATERQSPDGLLQQDNLTGAVAAIQDDPDSPDGNWLTYITNNVDTVCRVSFPTPTGNPTVGADLQQFKIWVRKQPGTGTPTVRIELYENNVSKATVMAATNVTNATGELFSATWNANLLGTADGSLVECYIYGAAVGGAPAGRCTVEIGAVEWNVDYSTATTYYQAVAGTFAATGALFIKGLKVLGGTFATTGGLVKKTIKNIAGTFAPTGAVGKLIKTARTTGNFVSTGTLNASKIVFKAIGGTFSPTGTVAKKTKKVIAGNLTTIGTLARKISKNVAGTFGSTGALTRRIIKALDGIATFTGNVEPTFIGGGGMATCKFYMRDNKLTTVSGADAGTYLIKDNYADILISGVTYHKCPFDLIISKIDTKQDITMEIV